jgi:hypothetical protein
MSIIWTDPSTWAPPPSINPRDASTWTLASDVIPGIGRVSTVWNPIRFSPQWGMAGTPHHYETLVIQPDTTLGDSRTYADEQEARDGHARLVRALQEMGKDSTHGG